ncbi:plasmid partitioning protein RepB [Martelella alba]|uniref:Plasmid partitioning protein RepB n=1 Tax=Martelella alba TaxID=2590451 RepID=A0A506U800_9HYPH|nr:plasmid partitioning protein RepB [Martelella alba]TPW29231.1 plasmid partitioning protein RepB [Martelella alba]
MKKSILKMMSEGAVNPPAEGEAPRPQGLGHRARRSSPVIANVGKALSGLSEDSIVSLDPTAIDSSPFQDRFENDPEVETEIEELAASIAAEGQKIPILVRPHPDGGERYQLAYGHRRLAAIKSLITQSDKPDTIRVKAYVRTLSDNDLLIEQSLENGVRENLTWIEQAVWAAKLRDAGFSGGAIGRTLSLSKTPVSLMLKVSSSLPLDIVLGIGRAKNVGRPKWLAFAELLEQGGTEAADRVRALFADADFQAADGIRRMALATKAAKGRAGGTAVPPESREVTADGRIFGRLKSTPSGTTLVIPKAEADFAEWISTRMEGLVNEYLAEGASKTKGDMP